jgi:predicted small integral membrane protein
MFAKPRDAWRATSKAKERLVSVRLAKIFLSGCVGLFALLVGLDNICDYQTNFAGVQHILAMDTLPAASAFAWRSVTAPAAHHIAYAGIILVEFGSGLLCLLGALRLWRMLRADAWSFNGAKDVAVIGLTAAFALYFFGFMVVGGEWFEMWRSNGWNMQEPAFRFAGAIGVVLIFVNQADA